MKTLSTSRRLRVLLAGLAVAGVAAGALTTLRAGADPVPGTRSVPAAAPVRCEIAIDALPGATTIEGRVSAERRVDGSYRLAITSRSGGGSATIEQSGDFSAAPGTPARLGQTTLGGSPARYRAELEIRYDGQRLRCGEAL